MGVFPLQKRPTTSSLAAELETPSSSSPLSEFIALVKLLRAHGRMLGLGEEPPPVVLLGLQRLLRLQPKLEARQAARVPRPLGRLVGSTSSSARRTDPTLGAARRCLELSCAAYGPFGALVVGASRGRYWSTQRTLAGRAVWRRPNAAAFETLTRLSARHCLLYAQWAPTGAPHRGGYVPAHYIVADPTLRAVVLVVRGSLGLRDVLVDLQTAPAPRHLEAALGRGCHGGIAAAAARLVGLHEARLRAALQRRPGWRLLVTGHSLGGGVACFAARLLRRALPRSAAVHALSFAPVATLPLRQCGAYEDLADAFVLGADAVPRLSLGGPLPLSPLPLPPLGGEALTARVACLAGSLRHLLEAARLAGRESWAWGSSSSRAAAGGEAKPRRSRHADADADEALTERLLAHWRERVSRPHKATVYPPGRLLLLERAEEEGAGGGATGAGGSRHSVVSTKEEAGRGEEQEEGGPPPPQPQQGWRLCRRLDRRRLSVLDVRPSMLRDHGFDRYDSALRALAPPGRSDRTVP